MAVAPTGPAPLARVEPVAALVKTRLQEFGTPALVLLLALAIVLTLTRNWNAWEGGRVEQVTNEAYLRRDLTPLSTKVAGAGGESRRLAQALLLQSELDYVQAVDDVNEAIGRTRR
jgi:hypothetical protein